jgi:hypothetical protein
MTDITLFGSIFAFAMLLVGLALTGHVFSRISRQRVPRLRLQPLRIDHTRGLQPRGRR